MEGLEIRREVPNKLRTHLLPSVLQPVSLEPCLHCSCGRIPPAEQYVAVGIRVTAMVAWPKSLCASSACRPLLSKQHEYYETWYYAEDGGRISC